MCWGGFFSVKGLLARGVLVRPQLCKHIKLSKKSLKVNALNLTHRQRYGSFKLSTHSFTQKTQWLNNSPMQTAVYF